MFADDLTPAQLSFSPACQAAHDVVDAKQCFINSSSTFTLTTLFFSSPYTVCSNLEYVISNSQSLSKACPQKTNTSSSTSSRDEIFQRSAIYAIWSNEKAARIACGPSSVISSHGGVCLEEIVSRQVESHYTVEELCTSCQAEFWTSTGGNYSMLPQLYYSTIVNTTQYLSMLDAVCGSDFLTSGGGGGGGSELVKHHVMSSTNGGGASASAGVMKRVLLMMMVVSSSIVMILFQ